MIFLLYIFLVQNPDKPMNFEFHLHSGIKIDSISHGSSVYENKRFMDMLQRSEIRSKMFMNFKSIGVNSLNSEWIATPEDEQIKGIGMIDEKSVGKSHSFGLLFNGLTRGTSEDYSSSVQKKSKSLVKKKANTKKSSQPEHLSVNLPENSPYLGEFSQGTSQPLEEDQLSPISSDEITGSKGQRKLQKPKKTSKNVTKNLGKRLFRFIKDKLNYLKIYLLRSKIIDSQQQWEAFTSSLRQWKKQNNITRQFLLDLWSGQAVENKIFRVLSQHFFRKRCIPSIFESNISDKDVHVSRVNRFLRAVQHPEALDNLI